MKEDVGTLAIIYGRKKQRHNNVLYTALTAALILIVFLSMVGYFYTKAEDEAHEMLHMQTKQIKDDLTLQIKSDRENLVTMANFAAKLYSDGESYDLLFDSFKPIGLFNQIRILKPDNTFITKSTVYDLNGVLSFEEEASKGTYITGRIEDPTREGNQIIRSAVPIKVNDETVGMLYGIIQLETINDRYNEMAKELEAQLFVYDKETGKFFIDTINDPPDELSSLKDREYKEKYSYNDFLVNDSGFSSFKSIRTGEDLFIHYSTIEDFDWGIILARYETQVFADTHKISGRLFLSFITVVSIIALYLIFVMSNEKKRTKATEKASHIRKLLLDINQRRSNILKSLKNVQEFSASRSSFFVDTDGEDYSYIMPEFKDCLLSGEERKYFVSTLFRYAADLHNINMQTIGFMSISPGEHLLKTNKELYDFCSKHQIKRIDFATITDNNNHVSILGVINPKKAQKARVLIEDVAVCFSIAIFNKKHLNKTEVAATTDSLTGVLNRVSFKKDILVFDQEKPEDFTCIYIDVNELHIRNNKYGHAAGDEMLIYIANALKEVFYGQYVYRMGGDEFLVFAQNAKSEQIKKQIEIFIEKLKLEEYNVAIGTSHRKRNINCEEMVREAEIRMYEAKAQYYQNKEKNSISKETDKDYVLEKTGIKEVDTMLSVLKEHYNGIYKVSLENNTVHRILMPSYLNYREDESDFSKILTRYVDEVVHPDFHRVMMSFLNYDAIKRQLAEGLTPKVTYKKIDGETVALSVYNLEKNKENTDETLWVFAKV